MMPNQTVQRTGASRHAEWRCGRRGGLAPVADLCRSAKNMEYVYTAWFRDTDLDPDDQDYEWPACMVIDAPGRSEATEWGDHHAKTFSSNRPNQQFLRSGSEPIEHYAKVDMASVPRIQWNQEATDAEISW